MAPPEPSAQTPPTSGATANQTELLKAKVLSCRLNFGILASLGLSTQPDLNSYMELKWLHPLTEYVQYLCWIRTVQVAFPVELTPTLPQPVKCPGRMMPANSTFSTPITSTFNAMCFDENSFTCQCKKEDRNSYGFQILHFYWLFSSDIMAVKGLKLLNFMTNLMSNLMINIFVINIMFMFFFFVSCCFF